MSTNNQATLLHELGRDQEAATKIRRAIDIFVNLLGEDNGRVALASVNECEILTSLGRFDQARAAIQNALGIWQRQGGSWFYVASALLDQGKLELAEGDPLAARGSLDRALALAGTQDRHLTADIQFALARALLTQSRGNRPRALELARTARGAIAGEPASDRLARKIDVWVAETGASSARAQR
jgi:tetratricopeptide (TPR) repeat protein